MATVNRDKTEEKFIELGGSRYKCRGKVQVGVIMALTRLDEDSPSYDKEMAEDPEKTLAFLSRFIGKCLVKADRDLFKSTVAKQFSADVFDQDDDDLEDDDIASMAELQAAAEQLAEMYSGGNPTKSPSGSTGGQKPTAGQSKDD